MQASCTRIIFETKLQIPRPPRVGPRNFLFSSCLVDPETSHLRTTSRKLRDTCQSRWFLNHQIQVPCSESNCHKLFTKTCSTVGDPVHSLHGHSLLGTESFLFIIPQGPMPWGQNRHTINICNGINVFFQTFQSCSFISSPLFSSFLPSLHFFFTQLPYVRMSFKSITHCHDTFLESRWSYAPRKMWKTIAILTPGDKRN